MTSVLVVTVSVLAAAQVSAAAELRIRPTLAIAGSGPITVTGSRFVPLERVTVRLALGGQAKLSRVVIANRLGKLVVRFAGELSTTECGGFIVTAQAIGARGSSAVVRRLEIPPPCGIAPQP